MMRTVLRLRTPEGFLGTFLPSGAWTTLQNHRFRVYSYPPTLSLLLFVECGEKGGEGEGQQKEQDRLESCRSFPALPLPDSGILGKVLIQSRPVVSVLGVWIYITEPLPLVLSSVTTPQGHFPALGSLSTSSFSFFRPSFLSLSLLQSLDATCPSFTLSLPPFARLLPWPGFAIKIGANACFLLPNFLL